MPKTKVWIGTKGELFHDECFEEGESREDFTPANLTDLDENDVCEACAGAILAGPADDDDDEDEE